MHTLQAAAARFLKQSTSINVWLELVMPDSHDGHTGDMFQVLQGSPLDMPFALTHHSSSYSGMSCAFWMCACLLGRAALTCTSMRTAP